MSRPSHVVQISSSESDDDVPQAVRTSARSGTRISSAAAAAETAVNVGKIRTETPAGGGAGAAASSTRRRVVAASGQARYQVEMSSVSGCSDSPLLKRDSLESKEEIENMRNTEERGDAAAADEIMHKENKKTWKSVWDVMLYILVGQILSLILSGTSIFTQGLAWRGVNMPVFQSFPNYVLMATVYSAILYLKTGSLWPGITWKLLLFYFVAAIIDTQANFLAVLTYQYVTINIAMLLDSFAIPVSGVLTFFIFATKYGFGKILGVVVTMLGMGLTVVSDVEKHQGGRWPGYVMAPLGGALEACSNVLEEYLVTKTKTKRRSIENQESVPDDATVNNVSPGEETTFSRWFNSPVSHHDFPHEAWLQRCMFLAWLGFFGTIINGIQSLAYDYHHIKHTHWTLQIFLMWGCFTLCMFSFESLLPWTLQRTGAVFLNLSLLTSDFYGVLYFWLRKLAPDKKSWKPSALYFVAFALTITGCVVYTIAGTKVWRRMQVWCCRRCRRQSDDPLTPDPNAEPSPMQTEDRSS